MTIYPELIIGLAVGMAGGALLLPMTQRELARSVARKSDGLPNTESTELVVRKWQKVALVSISGLLPGTILFRAGWSIVALPPLLLLLSLTQLAYCDLTRFLLPKSMVHVTTICVAASAIVAAALTNEWHRLYLAALCSAGLFVLLFAINLMNPAWMAFGDVRLAPAVGLGLAWITPLTLLQGFFLANVLAAVTGLVMISTRKAKRKTALPFGLYLAVASGAIVLLWS